MIPETLLGSPLSKIEWEEVSLNNVQCHSESGTVVIKFTRVMIQGVQESFFDLTELHLFFLYRENSPTNHRENSHQNSALDRILRGDCFELQVGTRLKSCRLFWKILFPSQAH